MLCVNKYPQKYVDMLSKSARSFRHTETWWPRPRKQAGEKNAALDAAIETFEADFFGNMVLVLDDYFVHRARGWS